MRPLTLATFVAVLLLFDSAYSEEPEPLSAAELRNLPPGTTSTGNTNSGSSFHAYRALDGTLRGRSSGITDKGTWEITDDGQLCRKWTFWDSGKRRCWIYFKKGDEYEYWYADRSGMRGKVKIRPGNPENL